MLSSASKDERVDKPLVIIPRRLASLSKTFGSRYFPLKRLSAANKYISSILNDRRERAEAKARSTNIDEQIEEERRTLGRSHYDRNNSIVLLGFPGSGKSTVFKQMRLEMGDYTVEERLAYRPIVRETLIGCSSLVINASQELGVFDDHALPIQLDSLGVPESLTIAEALRELWSEPIAEAVKSYARTQHLDLPDVAEYFIFNAERIVAEDYIPTIEDILRSREEILSVSTIPFNAVHTPTPWRQSKSHMYNLVNIPDLDSFAPRYINRKVLNMFDNASCLIFCASLSSYDRPISDDSSETQLQQSLVCFETLANLNIFRNTALIVLLTKVETFRNKLSKTPLEQFFPECTGGNDFDKATSYLCERFRKCARSERSYYPLEVFLVQEDDVKDMQTVVRNIQDAICRCSLRLVCGF